MLSSYNFNYYRAMHSNRRNIFHVNGCLISGKFSGQLKFNILGTKATSPSGWLFCRITICKARLAASVLDHNLPFFTAKVFKSKIMLPKKVEALKTANATAFSHCNVRLMFDNPLPASPFSGGGVCSLKAQKKGLMQQLFPAVDEVAR